MSLPSINSPAHDEIDYESLQRHKFSERFGDATADEIKMLKISIATNGMEDPIILYQGQILDGWHRYKILEDLGGLNPSREQYAKLRGLKGADAFKDLSDVLDKAEPTDKDAGKYAYSLNFFKRSISQTKKAWLWAQDRELLDLKDDDHEKLSDAAASTVRKCVTIQNAIKEKTLPVELGEMVSNGGLPINFSEVVNKIDREEAVQIVEAEDPKAIYSELKSMIDTNARTEKLATSLIDKPKDQWSATNITIWTPYWKHAAVDKDQHMTLDEILENLPEFGSDGSLFLVAPAQVLGKSYYRLSEELPPLRAMTNWGFAPATGKGGKEMMVGLYFSASEDAPALPLDVRQEANKDRPIPDSIVEALLLFADGQDVNWFDCWVKNEDKRPSGFSYVRRFFAMDKAPDAQLAPTGADADAPTGAEDELTQAPEDQAAAPEVPETDAENEAEPAPTGSDAAVAADEQELQAESFSDMQQQAQPEELPLEDEGSLTSDTGSRDMLMQANVRQTIDAPSIAGGAADTGTASVDDTAKEAIPY